jgi:hypothetical protein
MIKAQQIEGFRTLRSVQAKVTPVTVGQGVRVKLLPVLPVLPMNEWMSGSPPPACRGVDGAASFSAVKGAGPLGYQRAQRREIETKSWAGVWPRKSLKAAKGPNRMD